MARARRFPRWVMGLTPPAGMVTTTDTSIKLVNFRRQQAISGLNLIASLLDNKSSAHLTNANTYKAGMRQHYEQHTTPANAPVVYRYQTALDLAQKLLERDSAELNNKLLKESKLLKLAPERALWVGIPTELQPRDIQALNGSTNALDEAIGVWERFG